MALHSMILVFFLYLVHLIVSQECSLGYNEKFSLDCSYIDVKYPAIILLDQEFSISINESIANVSLFATADSFCGPDSFSQGHQCVINSLARSASVVCPSSSYLNIGPVSLIIGLNSCAINLNATLGQVTRISVLQNELTIDISNQVYVVQNLSHTLNISCSVYPTGPFPSITFQPFQSQDQNSILYKEGTNGSIFATFENQYFVSGVFICTSLYNSSTDMLYLLTPQGNPTVYFPNGNSANVTLGSSLTIEVLLLSDQSIDPSSIQFIPINDSSHLAPTIYTEDNQTFHIMYSVVGLDTGGLYEVCFSFIEEESSMSSGVMEVCSGIFNLTVSVPSVITTTNLIVQRASSYINGLVTVSCIPSDLNANILWLSEDMLPLWEVYSSYNFSPSVLNHTVTILSPPDGIVIILCGLYNPTGMFSLVNEQKITLVTSTRPVSIWNGRREVASNSIINTFETISANYSVLSLQCISEEEYDSLQWTTQDVFNLPVNIRNAVVESLSITGTNNRLTLNYYDLSTGDSGYYICSSQQGSQASVFVSLSNPYFNFTKNPSYIASPIGTNISFMIQYAYGSKGYGNNGGNYTFDLIASSTVLKINRYILQMILLRNDTYTYNHSITLSTSDSANFTLRVVSEDNMLAYQKSIQVHATVPVYNLSISPVYALLGRRVNMSCIPNDTIAPVNWGLWNYEEYVSLYDMPAFDISPLGHMIEYNLTSATFSSHEYSYDVDSGSYSQLRFRCGFRNGNDRNTFISPRSVLVNLEKEIIKLQNSNHYTTIYNNSIVNSFSMSYYQYEHRKRNVDESDHIRVLCTVVQGDEYPRFTAEFFNSPGELAVIEERDRGGYVYFISFGSFQRTLILTANSDTSGRYWCRSSITGVFNTFIITDENPFVRAKSNRTISAFLGDNITISFYAAVNSNGDRNNVYQLPVMFQNESGHNTNIHLSQSCQYDARVCYEFSHSFNTITPQYAGQYTAILFDEECDSPNCGANDSVTITVQVPQLITSVSSVMVFTGNDVTLDCTPSQRQFLISWFHNNVSLNCQNNSYCHYMGPYHTTLNLLSSNVTNSGSYTCSLIVDSQVIVSKTIIVTIIENCPKNFANGILWEETSPNTVVSESCTAAGDQFRRGLFARRKCLSIGIWDPVDLTGCLLKEDSSESATLWITLNTSLVEIEILERTAQELLVNQGVSYITLSLESTLLSDQSVLVQFHITFNETSRDQLLQVSNILELSNEFGGYDVAQVYSGIQLFLSSSSCPCQSLSNIILLCSSGVTSPCNCVNDICQCVRPFIGDGVHCTLDSDGDNYPDKPLTSCLPNDTHTYCIQDNCVDVYNPDQDVSACQKIQNFNGCGFGVDIIWGVAWANTGVGQTDDQPCPGKAATIGRATRMCISKGVWGDPNVLNCLPVEYQNYLDEVEAVLSANVSAAVQLRRLSAVVANLIISTSQPVTSQNILLPGSLNATNRILQNVVDVLLNTVANSEYVTNLADTLDVVDVISNLLDSHQSTGWQTLEQSENSQGSDVLIDTAERYGVYLATTRNSTVLRSQNLVINAKQYSIRNEEAPLVFPQPGDLQGTSFTNRKASVSIPTELLRNRSAGEEMVPVVSIIFQNLETFLDSISTNISNNTRSGSLMWSGQVSERSSTTNVPINLTFSVTNFPNSSGYKCVYWDTVIRGWSDTGVVTLRNSIDDSGSIIVECQSYHLTAFAVLVDVSGSIAQTNPVEYTALKVVSYIGCAISLACLIMTIVFFVVQGKVLFKSVHFFVHLNLAISLFCGYFVFSVGVETARNNAGGCAFVAALLQYFFLSSFCWMLCEGVMLYLMLVKVFSSLAKRWYFFLILGWLPAIFPVVIGLAAGHKDYGVRDEYENLLYCWLSVDNGVIWAFVAPMIIIIIINTVFLVLALYAIWKTRVSQQSIKGQKGNQRALALSLFKASIVLLPLLGLTWLFGLLTVNRNTTVFAWLFTLLNSLQGAAIFILHVVRSDKVWNKVYPKLKTIRSKATLKLESTSSSYSLKSNQSTLKSYTDKSSIKMNSFKKTVSENVYSSGLGYKNAVALETLTEESEEQFTEKVIDDASDDTAARIRAKEKEAFRNENSSIC